MGNLHFSDLHWILISLYKILNQLFFRCYILPSYYKQHSFSPPVSPSLPNFSHYYYLGLFLKKQHSVPSLTHFYILALVPLINTCTVHPKHTTTFVGYFKFTRNLFSKRFLRRGSFKQYLEFKKIH